MALGFAVSYPSQTLGFWGYNFGSADSVLTIDADWLTENPVLPTDVAGPMEDPLPTRAEWSTENSALPTNVEWPTENPAMPTDLVQWGSGWLR